MYICDVLEDLGHEVLAIVSSLDDALRIAGANAPMIAIVDYNLAGKDDGVAVAHALSSQFGTQIIFMTGFSDASSNARLLEVNPVAILTKPSPNGALAEAVERALSRS